MRDKSILLSIQPQWCTLILNEEKTVEVRKSRPDIETPFKVFIYCTKKGRPLVYGDVFRGNWSEEYVQTYGYSKKEADKIWGSLNGKIIGEFICDRIDEYEFVVIAGLCGYYGYFEKETRLTPEEMFRYGQGETLYGWHISNLQIYEEPKPLSDCIKDEYLYDGGRFKMFEKVNKAPQSWCYITRVL